MLIAWYPLKDDIKDYSLSGFDLTNTNPASVVQDLTDGKLGKCYNFDGSGCLRNLDPYWTTFDISEFTIAAWFKPTAARDYNGAIGIQADQSAFSYTIMLDASCIPKIQVKDAAANWVYYNAGESVPLNTWTHVAVVIKNNTYTFYINGVKKNTGTIPVSVVPPDQYTFFGAGCDFPGGDEYYKGKYNDIRMYDEALTTKQIREIYKTCILHYNFNDNYAQPITNMYGGGQFNSCNVVTTYDFQTEVFNDYGFNRALKLSPPVSYTGGNNLAYSYMLDPALFITGKTYTFVCYAYNSEDCNADIRVVLEGDCTRLGDSNGAQTWYLLNTVKGKVQLLWITFTATNTATQARIMFYPNPNIAGVFTTGYQLYAGMQIYEGDNVLLPSPFPRDGIVVDNSEFGNNGKPSSNIPLYDNKTSMIGTGSLKLNNNPLSGSEYKYIKTINPLLVPRQWTISCWIKALNTNQVAQNVYPIGWFNLCFCGTSDNQGDYRSGIIYTAVDSPASPLYWNPGGRNIFNGILHHWAITYDGDTEVINQYVDGILTDSGSITATNMYYLGKFRDFHIGCAWNSGYGGFTGNLDDVKVFANALSADDIKSIYKVRYALDPNGDFYCGELVEADNLTHGIDHMNINGTLKCDRVDELGIYGMDYKQLDDGSEWAKIFHHNNHSGTVLFSSNAEALDIQTDDKYSKLFLLEKFRASDGKFEMMLEYPDDLSGYNRWKQTSNPAVVTTASNGVTGYEAISISWTDSGWGGLEYSGVYPCFIDGSVNSGNTFYGIGYMTAWSGAIPGPSTPIQYVELWVRIDQTIITSDIFKMSKDNILMTHSIKEN